MTITNLTTLRAAVQAYSARSDAAFTGQIPTFIQLAEQRIAFGGDAPLRTEPVRIRDMEKSVDLTFTDGVATAPTDFLEQRRLYWDGDLNNEVNYLSPREFHTAPWVQQTLQEPVYPLNYTVEGLQVLVGPAAGGTGKLLYFAGYEPLQGDTDTNALLQNAPGVYLHGALIEAFGFMRNAEEQGKALQAFAAQAGALNSNAVRARTSGAKLHPNTLPGMSDRR